MHLTINFKNLLERYEVGIIKKHHMKNFYENKIDAIKMSNELWEEEKK